MKIYILQTQPVYSTTVVLMYAELILNVIKGRLLQQVVVTQHEGSPNTTTK